MSQLVGLSQVHSEVQQRIGGPVKLEATREILRGVAPAGRVPGRRLYRSSIVSYVVAVLQEREAAVSA